SGSAAYALVLSLVRRSAELKGRIYVSPLFSGGRLVKSGVGGRHVLLEPGTPLELEAVAEAHDARLLLEGAASGGEVRLECGRLVVEEAEASELRPELEDRAGLASVRLYFYPTAFMFHGIDVLRPSAVRLAYSLAKAYRALFGRDLKQYADRAATALEFTTDAVRRTKVDIGGGRRVPAFYGPATLAVYGNVGLWLSLLRLGEHVGVGVSRAIGFGRYKLVVIELRQ
ncbi:MAG: CRISPR system precrRNA processing endoribonuclease RAMP protein Cas6, partial [Thermoproteus sp.]|nr:CRISPR system precrRNA processing endoribonuclease RAMP protein Cas6 [Thermoproteus sp.]